MTEADLIEAYLAGPDLLREMIEDMTPEQIDTPAAPGRWSTRQIICHLVDFDVIAVDRMKRIIAEQQPTVFDADPDPFAERLAYEQRDMTQELNLLELLRSHMAQILMRLPSEDFERTCTHSTDGVLTLRELLQRMAYHIPHHVQFIRQKRQTLGLSDAPEQ